MLPVAFFSDTHMLPGLHVTLLSLLDSLTVERSHQVEIFIFLDHVSSTEKENLRRTYLKNPKESTLHLRECAPKAPPGGHALHGSVTSYGKLKLPDLLPKYQRCVFLDCDLIVNRCICDLFDLFDGENILLADGKQKRKHSLDKELFKKANLDLEGKFFNSGVLGIDLELWRKRDVTSLCNETAKMYTGMFKGADQPLLNTALHSSFKAVGEEFNTTLYPNFPRVDNLEARIYHFVGSPKPWDFLGSIASNHFAMWRNVYDRTAIANRSPLRYSSMKRSIRISKQLIRALGKRLK